MMLSTHSDRLERWLGAAEVARISRAMAQPKGTPWYGPPIRVAVPGHVWATADGDFVGPIRAGQVVSLFEQQFERWTKKIIPRWSRRQWAQANMAGFGSLSDLIAEATQGGKAQVLNFNKTLNTQVQFGAGSAWRVGPQPAAGANGGTPPDNSSLGRCTSATTGAMPFVNAASGDYMHFVSAFVNHSAGGALLLYDRLYHLLKTMNSTSTEAVTGTPGRYQNTTTTAADYIGGNFAFVEVGATQLAATAHNWTVCTYTDQAGNASTFPSMTGNSAGIIDRLDHPLASWFMPLESGDSGVKAFTQLQCSAAVATGIIVFVIGHPIMWTPNLIATQMFAVDGVNGGPFQMSRIFDDACLAFLNIEPPATTAPTLTGSINIVSG
jgi:hypothetical protein